VYSKRTFPICVCAMGSGAEVIGYVRVSTDDQEASGASLKSQREAIRAECGRRGWKLLRFEEDARAGPVPTMSL
jgi:Resolvase, N terminal domain